MMTFVDENTAYLLYKNGYRGPTWYYWEKMEKGGYILVNFNGELSIRASEELLPAPGVHELLDALPGVLVGHYNKKYVDFFMNKMAFDEWRVGYTDMNGNDVQAFVSPDLTRILGNLLLDVLNETRDLEEEKNGTC